MIMFDQLLDIMTSGIQGITQQSMINWIAFWFVVALVIFIICWISSKD